MGQLKPGTTYVYERDGSVVYAREFGDHQNPRQVVGWDYDKNNPKFDPRTSDGRPLHDHIMEDKLWSDIRRAAKTNPALQAAIEHVK